MFGVTHQTARGAETSPGSLPGRHPAHRRAADAPGPAADYLCPHGIARWAWGEGLRAGDAVALLVRDLGQSESLRLGLGRIGVHVRCLDAAACGPVLAGALAGAALAIVDTRLAEAYGTVMGRLAAYPAVWWNGPGADFARLDLALAELG